MQIEGVAIFGEIFMTPYEIPKRKAENSLNFLQFIHEILHRIGYNGR